MTQAGRGTGMTWSGSPEWKRRPAVPPADGDVQTRQQPREREKDRLQDHTEAQLQAAAAQTAEVEGQATVIDDVLASALAVPPFSFDRLMTFPRTPRFDPGALGQRLPAPDWSSFEPPPPRGLRRFLGGTARYRRQRAEAEIVFAGAVSDHQHKERQQQRALADAKYRHDQDVTEQRGQAAARNAHIRRLKLACAAGDAEAVTWFAGRVLEASRYPEAFPREYQVSYRPDSRELMVEFALPPRDVIPAERAYRYVKTHDVIEPLPRPASEIRQRYRRLVSSVALRTLHEIFSATPPDVVQAVSFAGHVTTTDRATGHTVRPVVLAVSAQRSAFAELVLAAVEPATCLAGMNAVLTPDPGGPDTVPSRA